MLSTVERYLAPLVGLLLLLLLGAFVLIGMLFVQLSSTRDDLARVEAGAALATIEGRAIRETVAELEPSLRAGLDEAIAGLESFRDAPLEFAVDIDEMVDIDVEIPVSQDLVIPIELTLPVSETLRTTITVEGPLGVDVPVNVTVPIELDVPVATEVVVPLDQSIAVNTTVPLQLNAPVRLDLEGSGLETVTESLLTLLRELRTSLDGLK